MLERIIHGCSVCVYIYRVWNTFDSALLYVLLRLWFSFGEELKGAETESIVHFEKKEGEESQNIKEKIQKPTKDREAIEGGNGEKIDEKTWGFEKKRRKRKSRGENDPKNRITGLPAYPRQSWRRKAGRLFSLKYYFILTGQHKLHSIKQKRHSKNVTNSMQIRYFWEIFFFPEFKV